MFKNPNVRVIPVVPRTWLGRVVATAAAVALLLLAIFFFMLVVIGVSIAVVILISRAIWLARRPGQQASGDIVDVEYSVEKDRPRDSGGIQLFDDRRKGP